MRLECCDDNIRQMPPATDQECSGKGSNSKAWKQSEGDTVIRRGIYQRRQRGSKKTERTQKTKTKWKKRVTVGAAPLMNHSRLVSIEDGNMLRAPKGQQKRVCIPQCESDVMYSQRQPRSGEWVRERKTGRKKMLLDARKGTQWSWERVASRAAVGGMNGDFSRDGEVIASGWGPAGTP